MSDRHHTIPRTLCHVEHKSKILLIEFGEKKGHMKGLYNCPGGHIEQGEGVIESANREILEETGLTVTDTKLKGIVHVSNFFGKNIMMFVTLSHSDTQDLVESDEGKLHWIDRNDIYNLPVLEDIKLILTQIHKLGAHEVFTAKSVFDGESGLVSITFE